MGRRAREEGWEAIPGDQRSAQPLPSGLFQYQSPDSRISRCWLVYGLQLATRGGGGARAGSEPLASPNRMWNFAWAGLAHTWRFACWRAPWYQEAGCPCAGCMCGPELSRQVPWNKQGTKELRAPHGEIGGWELGTEFCNQQTKGWRSRGPCCSLSTCLMLGTYPVTCHHSSHSCKPVLSFHL